MVPISQKYMSVFNQSQQNVYTWHSLGFAIWQNKCTIRRKFDKTNVLLEEKKVMN